MVKKRHKKISVDDKVTKKPIYEDPRQEDPGGRPALNFDDEMPPEVEEMCVLVAEGKERKDVIAAIPEISLYKYKSYIDNPAVIKRVDEIRAEMLITNIADIEPHMFSLITALARYFKRKAARLDLQEGIAEKLMQKALHYFDARIVTNKKKGDNKSLQSNKDNKEARKLADVLDKSPTSNRRKPTWEASDFEEPSEDDEEIKENESEE